MSVHKRGREKGRSNWAVKLWLISGQVNCWAKLLSNALKVVPEVTLPPQERVSYISGYNNAATDEGHLMTHPKLSVVMCGQGTDGRHVAVLPSPSHSFDTCGCTSCFCLE